MQVLYIRTGGKAMYEVHKHFAFRSHGREGGFLRGNAPDRCSESTHLLTVVLRNPFSYGGPILP